MNLRTYKRSSKIITKVEVFVPKLVSLFKTFEWAGKLIAYRVYPLYLDKKAKLLQERTKVLNLGYFIQLLEITIGGFKTFDY